MAEKVKPEPAFKPHRRELYKIVADIRRDDARTPELRALQEKYEQAVDAKDRFLEENEEFNRLNKEAERLREEFYKKDRKHDERRSLEIRKVENYLQLHGADDKAVKMIERLIKKYRGHETSCMCVDCMGG